MAATPSGQYFFATRFAFRLETAMQSATPRAKMRSGERERAEFSEVRPSRNPITGFSFCYSWEVAMRIWPVMWIALILPASASPVVSPEDAETMRLEALADRAPDRIHGSFDFLLEDPDMAVDATTGQATSVDDDCSRVPVKVRRSDGRLVTQRVDVCD